MSDLRARLQTAGMVAPASQRLGESFLPAEAFVPAHLELGEDAHGGDELVWWIAPDGLPVPGDPQFVDPTGMLDAFVRVRNGRDVLGFARRFGVLGLCEHHLPASPSPLPARFHHGKSTGCAPRGWNDRLCRESVADWLGLVDQARAMLSIAAAIHCAGTPSRRDWELLVGAGVVPPDAGRDQTLDRRYLAAAVQWWLVNSRLGLWFEWDGAEPAVVLFGGTFDQLTSQLVNAVSRSHSMAICGACGLPYRASRKPQEGRRNYCHAAACQNLAALKRKRSSRARRKGDVS